ncbi:hypothetical protein ACFCWG_42710 [Streptomyces sp. NPDC056390]
MERCGQRWRRADGIRGHLHSNTIEAEPEWPPYWQSSLPGYVNTQ